MNGVSSFLDGSSLYGDTIAELKSIRTFRQGKISINDCKRYSIFIS